MPIKRKKTNLTKSKQNIRMIGSRTIKPKKETITKSLTLLQKLSQISEKETSSLRKQKMQEITKNLQESFKKIKNEERLLEFNQELRSTLEKFK
ncbi:MAG: hypothetical protein PHR26_03925 [Candidatus ainarchaeum sp.]|nr:hypothetical protein [Candidatus ainarchaeum sp.]MDD3976271.1 hypothetical protein [Candidatus ainarchaeum sp.]